MISRYSYSLKVFLYTYIFNIHVKHDTLERPTVYTYTLCQPAMNYTFVNLSSGGKSKEAIWSLAIYCIGTYTVNAQMTLWL